MHEVAELQNQQKGNENKNSWCTEANDVHNSTLESTVKINMLATQVRWREGDNITEIYTRKQYICHIRWEQQWNTNDVSKALSLPAPSSSVVVQMTSD